METKLHIQTQLQNQSASVDKASIIVSGGDRDILRRLAEQVRLLSERPTEREKRDLWYRHNDLEPARPLIFCDPENGWIEIITDDQMRCQGEIARRWELGLRKEIFWGECMGDDRVIEPTFDVAHVYTESDWGMHETQIGGEDFGAYRWESPLKSYDQIDALRFPVITVDYARLGAFAADGAGYPGRHPPGAPAKQVVVVGGHDREICSASRARADDEGCL